MLYKLLILPILQLINPEVSHFLAEKLLQLPFFSHLNPINYSKKNKITQTNIAGLELDSPIGLAAGYDKNCKTLKPLFRLTSEMGILKVWDLGLLPVLAANPIKYSSLFVRINLKSWRYTPNLGCISTFPLSLHSIDRPKYITFCHS